MDANRTMNVLIMEETQSEIKLIESILNDSSLNYELKIAKTENDFKKFINRFKPDVIIAGSNLMKYSAHEALEFLKEQCLLIPFILITGNISEELARDYIKKGVDDYLTRFNLLSLPAVLIKAIEVKKTLREKKNAEDQIRSDKVKLQTFYDDNPEAIFEIGFAGEILNMNPSAKEMLGGNEKNKKLKFIEFLEGDDSKAFKEAHGVVSRGQKKNLLLALRKGKKLIYYLDCKLIPMLNEVQEVISVLIIGIDVTSRIRTEQAYTKTQVNFDTLLNTIEYAIWSVDAEMKIDIFNEAAAKSQKKFSSKNMRKGMPVEDFASSKEREIIWRSHYQRAFDTGKFTVTEYLIHEGGRRQFEITVYPLIFNNVVAGATVIAHDITGIVMVEEELQRSEQLFRALSENSPVGIFKLDKGANCTYANSKLLEMISATQSEFTGKGWHSFLDPTQLDEMRHAWREAVVAGREVTMDVRYISKNKKIVWTTLKATPVYSANSELFYIGTVTDITELKNTLDNLKEKQLLVDTIEKTGKIGFYMIDFNDKSKDYFTGDIFKIFNSQNKSTGDLYKELVRRVHPEEVENFISEMTNVKKGNSVKQRFRILFNGDTVKYMVMTAFPVVGENGIVSKMTGSLMDISDIRMKEIEIEHQNNLIQHTFEMARIGSFEVDLSNNRLIWSRELKKLMNLKAGQPTPSWEVYIAMVHPDDRKKLIDHRVRQMKYGDPNLIEYRVFVQGEMKNILSFTYALKDENSRNTKIVGVMLDVTSERSTKDQLQATENLLQSLLENTNDAVFIEDEEGNILNANERACEMQGIKRSELIGKNILEFIPVQHQQAVMHDFKRLFLGEVSEYKSRQWTTKGEEMPIILKATPVVYKNLPAVLLNVRKV